MKMLLAAVLAAVVLTAGALAQTAGQIAASSSAALGIASLQSIRLQGVATEYGQASQFTVESRSDGKALLTTTSAVSGTTLLGWSGGGAWTQNDFAGGLQKTPVSQGHAEFIIKNITGAMGFAPRLDKAQSLEIAGNDNIGGIAVIVVRAVFDADDRRTIYLRSDNYLPVREIRNEPNQGNLDVVIDYSDYRTADGITVPWKITVTVAGKQVSATELTAAEVNPPLADALFSATSTPSR